MTPRAYTDPREMREIHAAVCRYRAQHLVCSTCIALAVGGR